MRIADNTFLQYPLTLQLLKRILCKFNAFSEEG
jgi:hypothetical protein